MNEITLAEQLSESMSAAGVAWWTMEIPSGRVTFGHNKTDLLGRDWHDFTHYKDFTDIVDPADYEPMMQDMRDHLEGRKPVYETMYRMQHANGKWLQFYDRGKIVERGENGYIKLAGVVTNLANLDNYTYNLAHQPYKPVDPALDTVD